MYSEKFVGLNTTTSASVREACERNETCVTPGSYFDMPDGFRVGIGGDPEMTREGLNRLGLALDELAESSPAPTIRVS